MDLDDAMDLDDTAAMEDMEAMDLDDSSTLTPNLPPMTARPEGVAGYCGTPPTIGEVQGARAAVRGIRRRGGRARRNAATKLTLKAWTKRTRWHVLYIKIRRCVHMKQERLLRTAQMERCFTRPPD